MGRDKAWVEYQGKPFIKVALEKVRQLGASDVFISGRPGADYLSLHERVLVDLEPGNGPLGGIERALREALHPLVLVLPVDLPQMPIEFLQKLVARCDSHTGVVPRHSGALEPLVAVYPSRCHSYAAHALASGQFAVRDFAKACLKERAVRPVHIESNETIYFHNCNTSADLALISGAGENG
jgi:molybdopterin-guanine dinucleotide biosynthesis protein A